MGRKPSNYTVTPPQLDTFPDLIDDAPSVVVYISPVSVKSPAPGEPINLSIDITNGENVAGYQLTLHFDSTGPPLCLQQQR